MNGQRFTPLAGGPVFVVFDGKLHLIPDPTTYNNLFVDWTGIQKDGHFLDTIVRGLDVSSGASLEQPASGGQVFLVSNGVKRWISNPDVFNKYGFSWSSILSISATTLDAIPTGPQISS